MLGVGFGVAAVALRFADGAQVSLAGLTITAAPWLAWIGGGALAFAAAEDRAAVDRREGIEALAAARGISPAGLEAARVLAAMSGASLAIGVPLVILGLLTAALAGRPGVVAHRAGVALGAAIFAAIAGVTLGGVGAISGRVGRARGRWVLLAFVAGPAVIADLAGHTGWSIPGALGAVLDFLLGTRGLFA
jgi:hypothetical protein